MEVFLLPLPFLSSPLHLSLPSVSHSSISFSLLHSPFSILSHLYPVLLTLLKKSLFKVSALFFSTVLVFPPLILLFSFFDPSF